MGRRPSSDADAGGREVSGPGEIDLSAVPDTQPLAQFDARHLAAFGGERGEAAGECPDDVRGRVEAKGERRGVIADDRALGGEAEGKLDRPAFAVPDGSAHRHARARGGDSMYETFAGAPCAADQARGGGGLGHTRGEGVETAG